MTLMIDTGDVLEARSDALILSIDGARHGLEGNIARQFGHRYPDAWAEIEASIKWPVPLGRSVAVDCSGLCPWRLMILASTLHHVDVLGEVEKQAVVRRAVAGAQALASRDGARSIATAVLTGGWRLGVDDAFAAMRDAWMATAGASGGVELRIVVPKSDVAEHLRRKLARRLP